MLASPNSVAIGHVAVHDATRCSAGFSKNSQSFSELLQKITVTRQGHGPGDGSVLLPHLDVPQEGDTRAPRAAARVESEVVASEGGDALAGEGPEASMPEGPIPVGVDPLAALAGSFGTGAGVAPVPTDARAWAAHEPLVCEIVRAIAWGGDRRRGTARIELGGARLGGGTVVVHAEGSVVRLDVEGPPGIDADALRARLVARLEARGFSVQD